MLSLIPTEWIAAVVALLAALGAVWGMGKANGALRAKNRGLQEEVDAHEVRSEVDNRIAGERDARERLRDDWQR